MIAPAEFDGALVRIGRLNYTWTNTESVLIHLIAGLAGTTKDAAVIIFLTLNTTRARIDLVDRLAKMDATPPERRRRILDLTGRMGRHAALRNHYNHSIYAFDPGDGGARTITMRIADRKDAIKVGRSRAIDAEALAEIDEAVQSLSDLNRDLWQAIRDFGYPT